MKEEKLGIRYSGYSRDELFSKLGLENDKSDREDQKRKVLTWLKGRKLPAIRSLQWSTQLQKYVNLNPAIEK